MPASRRSLALTDLYRSRLLFLRERVETAARQSWPDITGLDESTWPEQTARVVTRAQVDGVRLSGAYLAAYVRSETGRGSVTPIDSSRYAGLSRDGRPLTESLRSPLIGTLAALKDGQTASQALSYGLNRALRMVETDLMHATRESLREGMEAHSRIEGWQRSVKGTCGACMGDIAVEVSVQLPGVPLLVHPNCQCVTVPVVTGVRNLIPLPTGKELFDRMTRQQQDEGLGPVAAERIRAGDADLADLVGESHLETAENFITQAPVSAN